MENVNKYLVSKNVELKTAIKKIDDGAKKILFVIDDDGSLYGVLSDGDIRRWIINTGGIKAKVHQVCNLTSITVSENYLEMDVRKLFLENKISSIPVIGKLGEVVDIIFSDDSFSDVQDKINTSLNLPVIIMAGGKGTRLEPFTKILPKPLIPIGDKPIIEIIMDNYAKFGMTEFYISINHKAKMIRSYFEDQILTYSINFIEEDQPFGTAGSIKLLENKFTGPCFVSNCDIIIKDDYRSIYNFHQKGQFDLTLVACMQNHQIPYGVCEIESGGCLNKIIEKPEYNFLVNTGMYILNPSVFKLIPENTLYHITDLISDIMLKGGKVGVYPVSENSWIDIGQWEEYKNVIRHLTV